MRPVSAMSHPRERLPANSCRTAAPSTSRRAPRLRVRTAPSRTSLFRSTSFKKSIFGGVVAAVMISLNLLTSSAFAQPPVEKSYPAVFLESAEAYKRDGNTFIAVRGRCPDVPKGCTIDFVLTWKSQSIDTFPFKNVDGTIDTEFQVRSVPRTRDHFYFRSIIRLEKQSSKTRRALEAIPEKFPPTLAPWTGHHSELRFRLFKAQEFKASRSKIRTIFETRVELLEKIDAEVRDAFDLAQIGEEYTKPDGSFDVTAWRAWFDGHAIETLRTQRKDIREWVQESRFLPYRRSLAALDGLVNRVASRAFARSVELYEFHKLGPLRSDVKPGGFELQRVGRSRALELQPELKLIHEEIGIIPSDRVEYPYALVLTTKYSGATWRHLTAEELAEGKFDSWRTRATWTPSEKDVARLEAGLHGFLQENATEKPELAETLSFYRRQYLGYGPESERVIRVILIWQGSRIRDQWLVRALAPQDEPGSIHSLEFDMSTGAFQKLEVLKPNSN